MCWKTTMSAVIGAVCLAGAAQAQTGACCFTTPFGGTACAVVTADRCAAVGGTYQGDGTVCDATACPPAPTGACCLNLGARDCVELTEAVCDALGGRYQGDGTTCAATVCAPPPGPCPCDVDGDGDLDVQDIITFLDAWFAGNADFDGDGDTDVHDLIAFIRCFFRGCP